MTLLEFVATHCPDGPPQLRRLILERTGVSVPYAYCWKWCNAKKLAAVSVENAALLHAATEGKCTLNELLSLKTIRTRRVPKRAKAKAAAKSKPKRPARNVVSKLRARIAELEAQLVQVATDASRVA